MVSLNDRSALTRITAELKELSKDEDLSLFYARLGGVWGHLYKDYKRIYGDRTDFYESLKGLVVALLHSYRARTSELRALDEEREGNTGWFLSQNWVATMLYVNRFSGDLKIFREKIPYLQELGINIVHLMPLLRSPDGPNDGGYAVKDYRTVDPRFGSDADLDAIAREFRKHGILLCLDLVLNHTADEHEWARKALAGDPHYLDYYYLYEDRTIPDEFEKTLPEVFPDLAPGNFTWRDEIKKWVFTVFNRYQWDLNYTNPEVLTEMTKVLLHLANRGVDVLRLDAVPFLWKRIGTNSQNEPEAHILLQIIKSCARVVAPGAVFLAEAIVQPVEIVKYLGQGEAAGRECEIAYNASMMVFLWDALATKNANLMLKGLENIPAIPAGTTWINYVRCHDDIGLGFSDRDARDVGYDPALHRRFLIDYYTGRFPGSFATGAPFMENPKTGDARISGTLASLCGLEKALAENNRDEIDKAVRRILLLHSVILSFGGIPLIYYGDEIATVNDRSYLGNPALQDDNRWMHRPVMDWTRADRRRDRSTIEGRVFQTLRHWIGVRKARPEFSAETRPEWIRTDNYHLFAYLRQKDDEKTLAVVNFSDEPQSFPSGVLARAGFEGEFFNRADDGPVPIVGGRINLAPYGFLWIGER